MDHFIDVIRDEVSVVKDLPADYSWSTREYYATGIRATRIKTAPVQATADWYIENVLPILQRYVNSLTSLCYFSFFFSQMDLGFTTIVYRKCLDLEAFDTSY